MIFRHVLESKYSIEKKSPEINLLLNYLLLTQGKKTAMMIN